MRLPHHALEFFVLEHLHAEIGGLAEIGLRHPGGAASGRAVEEIFDAADRQHVVADAREQPGLDALRHDAAALVAEQGEPGAHRQAAVAAGAMIGGDLAEAGAHPRRRLHAAGDAERVEIAPAALDRGDEFVVARRRQDFLDRGAGVLGEQAGETAAGALDEAAFGRRRRFVDPGERQRPRIDDRDMAAGAHQHRGMVGNGAVEIVARRVAAGVELGLVVAARQHPAAGRRRARALRQRGEQRFERRRFLGPRVDPVHVEAERNEMQMRIVEAGRREAPVEFDDSRAPADQRRDVGFVAARQHTAAPDRQRAANALGAPPPDRTAAQDDVGFDDCHHSLLFRSRRAARSAGARGDRDAP